MRAPSYYYVLLCNILKRLCVYCLAYTQYEVVAYMYFTIITFFHIL